MAQIFLYRFNGYSDEELRVPDKYEVIRETEYYYWISLIPGKQKRVSKNGKKRFAHTSIEKAKESYIARKRRQVEHCFNNIILAEDALFRMGVNLTSVVKDKIRREFPE